jgi:hypothetical protein
MTRNRRRSQLFWLTGVSLVLACVIYAEIRAPAVVDASPLQAKAAESLPAPKAPSWPAIPTKSKFAEIIDRPLFSSSRRAQSAETSVAATQSMGFSLLGIVISTDAPVALLKPDTGGAPLSARQGDEISGWRVARIEPDRVVILHDTVERELYMDFAAPAPQPPAPEPETAEPMPPEAEGQSDAQTAAQPHEEQQDEQVPEPAPVSKTNDLDS